MKLMIEQNRKNLMSYSMNLQTLLIANVQNICFIVLKKGTISSITHRYNSKSISCSHKPEQQEVHFSSKKTSADFIVRSNAGRAKYAYV